MQKKQARQTFYSEKQTGNQKRGKIKAGEIINLTYNGYTVVLVGHADLAAWNAMDRKERRKFAKDMDWAIEMGVIKMIEVEVIVKGLPQTKKILVPPTYKGTGKELIEDEVQPDGEVDPDKTT